jgi:hypothetical protein
MTVMPQTMSIPGIAAAGSAAQSAAVDQAMVSASTTPMNLREDRTFSFW